jgi:hypothetical protein
MDANHSRFTRRHEPQLRSSRGLRPVQSLAWQNHVPVPFADSREESQRDSSSKPRVASHELPWETWPKSINPNDSAIQGWLGGATPSGLKTVRMPTQGSSCFATRGLRPQSLWDCRRASEVCPPTLHYTPNSSDSVRLGTASGSLQVSKQCC